MSGFDDYWYVIAESEQLKTGSVLARCVLDENLVCFRSANGQPTVLQDRCLHRHAPLSGGSVHNGLLSCPYHGWTYDGGGCVVSVPSMGCSSNGKISQPFPVIERDGYVYVRLKREGAAEIQPFNMPHYQQPGWHNLRLQNRFANNVSNCVENFIDIPHTAFVHRAIFRASRGERLSATVTRINGEVHVSYRNEQANLGSYRWFLNPRGQGIQHTDSFYAPNVTSVVYEIGTKRFIITSQSVPVAADETLVYTDLTYAFGKLNTLAAPFVRRHAQRIIDQDIEILAAQMKVIKKYGCDFSDTPADVIHRCVDSIREAIARGDDPRSLAPLTRDIEFTV